jgi:hypothetical protein
LSHPPRVWFGSERWQMRKKFHVLRYGTCCLLVTQSSINREYVMLLLRSSSSFSSIDSIFRKICVKFWQPWGEVMKGAKW